MSATADALQDMTNRTVEVTENKDGTTTVGRLPVPTVAEVLERMELEWTPERYARNVLARNADGIPVDFYNPTAERFCGLGFLSYLTFDHRGFGDCVSSSGSVIPVAMLDFDTELRAEFDAVKLVYLEVRNRIERELKSGDISTSNDNAQGHTYVMNGVKKARATLAKETVS